MVIISQVPPLNPAIGQLWFNSKLMKLFIYLSTDTWVEV